MKGEWVEHQTGGGCMALLRQEPDGSHWLLTDWDEPKIPIVGKPAALGEYDRDGIQLTMWRVPNFSTGAEALEKREEYDLVYVREEGKE